ncbi:MAG: hypothetical protein ABIJ08_03965, partial [Nanoarchaeota archaeon]
MKKNKKAQGINAAILVAIISALIIMYMLFLPTNERERLLGEDGKEGTTTSSDNIVLLQEGIGRLDPSEQISDKEIPNVYLFESTDSKDLAVLNPVYVRNGLFDEKIKTASFTLSNLDNMDNVALSFTAPKRTGVLTIKLNDAVVYEYDLNKLNVDPIKIDNGLLRTENTLEFGVSGVGWKFWATNEYSLENIKIIGDITDKSRQESRNIFTLTGTEYQNLERAELRFIPYCGTVGNLGTLNVDINNYPVYSAVPVCDDPVKQSIPSGILSSGSNKVIFKTSRGSYSVEQIKVAIEAKEAISNVYYFEVNETTYDNIKNNNKKVYMKVMFVDDTDRKRADLNINGHLYRIDQYDKTFEREIMNW